MSFVMKFIKREISGLSVRDWNMRNYLERNLGYVARIPVNPDDMADEKTLKDWIENRNMRAFSFYHKKEHTKVVDIVLEHPLDFTEAFQRGDIKKVGGIEIYVASIDDIIAMKKVSNWKKLSHLLKRR